MPRAVSESSMCNAARGAPSGTPTCPHCDAPVSADASRCAQCHRALAICGGLRLGPEIDRGGVARIHAASSRDDVAVKLMERTAFNPWQVHQLFARSARLLSGFDHPGLPRVHGFEKSEGGRSFMAMERLHGGTLYDRVARARIGGAALDALLSDLLSAVGYLHERAFVHGDVTPRNVMFRARGARQPVLVDFDGLCTTHERGVASLVMTPGYTAPEQRAGEVSAAADLYGVGATVVFAATGRSPDELQRTGTEMELELGAADVSPTARRLLQRLVALDPKKRPRSARAALRALEPRSTRVRRVAMQLLVAATLVVVAWALAASAVAFVSGAPARPMPPHVVEGR